MGNWSHKADGEAVMKVLHQWQVRRQLLLLDVLPLKVIHTTVSWSPKGKHLAIGLRSGDIVTFALTNKSSPNKHIPPTANASLVSLSWLTPGHTFRTTYAPPSGGGDSSHHIISLDPKASTATYFSPTHPYPLPDRTNQHAFTVVLSKWDEKSPPAEEPKSLVLVGDAASVDLEVLGGIGNKWYQQSQENPLTLPLDKNMEDTTLVALDVDLTDTVVAAPIIYAYLSDGTLQAWYAEHSTPYGGMSSPQAAAPQQSSVTGFGDMQLTPSTPFGQGASAAPFGQNTPPSFAQQTNAFGAKPFGQSSPQPAFGAPSFGSPSLSFGQQQPPNSGSVFGQPSQPAATGFGASPPANQQNTSAFNSTSTNAFGGATPGNSFGNGSGGFGAFAPSGTTNAFGQATFGFGAAPAKATLAPPSPPAMTREASMSDSTPTFGGLSLGADSESKPKAGAGIFGTFSTPPQPTPPTSSGFGSAITPATGFGAFGSFQTTQPPADSGAEKKPTTSSSFSAGTPSSAFGQSGFGQPGFAKPAFGQSGFGQSAFGKATPPSTTTAPASGAPSGGAFSAFASAGPTSFGGGASGTTQPFGSGSGSGFASQAPATSTGGFGAFASAGPTAFGTQTSKPSMPFGSASSEPPKSPFTAPTGGNTPAFQGFAGASASTPSVFGAPTGGKSPFSGGTGDKTPPPTGFGTGSFGTIPSTPSPFGNSMFSNATAPTKATPTKPAILESPPSSPEAAPAGFTADTTTPASSPPGTFPTPSTGAFGGLKTSPSVFKPASGFGAFGNDSGANSSPFFKKQEGQTPPVSAFSQGRVGFPHVHCEDVNGFTASSNRKTWPRNPQRFLRSGGRRLCTNIRRSLSNGRFEVRFPFDTSNHKAN